MKYLALLAMYCFAVPMNGQQASTQAHSAQQKTGGEQPQNYESVSVRTVSIDRLDIKQQQGSEGKSNQEKLPLSSYLRRLIAPETLPNLILCVAGIAGIVVAWRSLKTLETQTKAARDAAEAARLNAQAIINAERAWVVIRVEYVAPYEFNFRAVNVGKTPAKITGIYSSQVAIRRGQEFEVTPEYDKGESLISSPPCFLPATDGTIIWRCNLTDLRGTRTVEEWIDDYKRGLYSVTIYGKITYYDTLEASPKEPHVTKWLYWHVPIPGALPIPDPKRPEYNSYT